ncbi:MAG TPA: amino acid ABC transporter permease [Gammaproteobacteria bacterium]|nr:amino acid ABC transporter permease [Gammaproteobacteria bacterium]
MNDLLYSAIFISKGILITLQLLVCGISIGLILGLLASIGRYKGIAKTPINSIISVIRGTPLILQLAFVYFALPGLTGIKLNIIMAGIITFGLNSSAYVAEILRAGINNIPKGQFEAAKALKIPNYPMWKDIILPQVIKNVLPAMISEIIALLKETSLIATIGGMDIMRSAQTVAAEQFTYFTPLCIAGVYYYTLVLFIEHIGRILEKKVNHANS